MSNAGKDFVGYEYMERSKTAQVTPVIGQKQDETYSVCGQTSRLLQS